jgi:hypothetical protein
MHLKKWAGGKINLCWRDYQWEGSGHKERGDEGIYSGCVFYSYMEIVE